VSWTSNIEDVGDVPELPSPPGVRYRVYDSAAFEAEPGLGIYCLRLRREG